MGNIWPQIVVPLCEAVISLIMHFSDSKKEVDLVRIAAHSAQMDKLADDNKKEQNRLAKEDAELNKLRERLQAEMEQLRTELGKVRDNNSMQQAQRNLQELQRRMEEKEEQLAKEKSELKRKQEMEIALKEDRYRLRTPKDLERLKREAKDKVNFDNNEWNVGVTGQTGCGKSTFINGLCEFALGASGAAKTDENECTTEMKKYQHPQIRKLALWDLPGAGTATHPISTYFHDQYLYMFGALVIMHDTRFKEDDADLIRQAMAFGLPFVVVRNKANHALESRKRLPENRGKSEEVIMRELIDECRQNTVGELAKFKTHIDHNSIFIINAWAFMDENEPHFEEAKLIEYLVGAIAVMYSRH